MALINCPECNKKISDKSDFCINCGFPFAKIKIIKEEALETIRELRTCRWKNGYAPNYNEYLEYIDDCALSDSKVVEQILSFICDDIGLQLTPDRRHNFTYIINWLNRKKDLFNIQKKEDRNIAINYLTIRQKILTAKEMLFGEECSDKIVYDIKWVRNCCPELFDDTLFSIFLEKNFSKFINI